MNFNAALQSSGLGPAYAKSNYRLYGELIEESIRITVRVCVWERCPPEMLSLSWMNESSFRLYLKPQTNEKSNPENVKNPDKWDFGGLQINRGLYRENVRIKYYHGLPEEDVFGRVFFDLDGTPAEFNGNPLINAQAGARILMRTTGLWQEPCVQCSLFSPAPIHTDAKVENHHEFFPFRSLEEYRVGRYCGPDSRPHRVKSWREWQPLFTAFFQAYGVTK